MLEKLEPMPNATDEIVYGDNQVYEDVDGYESLRKIFKYKLLKNHIGTDDVFRSISNLTQRRYNIEGSLER